MGGTVPRPIHAKLMLLGAGFTSMCELQDDRIGGLLRERVAHAQDVVTDRSEQVGQILWYVLVEQELHRGSCAICRATSKSTSPR